MRLSYWGRLDFAGVIHKKEIRSCRRETQVPTNSNLFKISTSRFDKHTVNNRNAERRKNENKNMYENKQSLKDNIIC